MRVSHIESDVLPFKELGLSHFMQGAWFVCNDCNELKLDDPIHLDTSKWGKQRPCCLTCRSNAYGYTLNATKKGIKS
jgi:hypothetical protein